MNTQESVGNYIRENRKRKGWTQEQLAEKVEVWPKTISNWENGKGEIKPDNLQKLAQAFNVSAAEIMAGKDMPELSEEDKQRLDQAIQNLSLKIEDVREITIKVEGQGLLSIELGFYAFGLAISAFFLAWWVAFGKTLVTSIVCFSMVVFGLLFMILGKRAIQVLEKKRQSRKDLPKEDHE